MDITKREKHRTIVLRDMILYEKQTMPRQLAEKKDNRATFRIHHVLMALTSVRCISGRRCFSLVKRSFTVPSLSPSPKCNSYVSKAQAFADLARMRNPIGTYLLFWPCIWGSSMALQAQHLSALDPLLFSKFIVGAFLMRGAGCTVNDLWDMEIDKKVERTIKRPLASGALSVKEAVAFLGVQLSGALAILLSFDWSTIGIGVLSLLPVAVYPAMKRITHFPQLFLGITINWGVLVGFSSVGLFGHAAMAPMYLSAISWTVVYDTIYAHQDKLDDQKIGVKSTALTFGKWTKPILGALSVQSSLCMAAAGYAADLGPVFYCLSVITPVIFNTHQLYHVNLDNPRECSEAFKAHGILAMVIGSGIILGSSV